MVVDEMSEYTSGISEYVDDGGVPGGGDERGGVPGGGGGIQILGSWYGACGAGTSGGDTEFNMKLMDGNRILRGA